MIEIIKYLRKNNNKTFLYNDTKKITYKEFYSNIQNYITFFKKNKIKSNDIIGIDNSNSVFEKLTIFFTALILKNSVSLVNVSNKNNPANIVIKKKKIIRSKLNFNFKSPKIFIYSSGTTNISKIIIHDQKKIFAAAKNFCSFYNIKNKKFINFLPLSYMGGIYNLTLIPFVSGSSIFIHEKNQQDFLFNFWNTLKKNNLNLVWITPEIAKILILLGKKLFLKQPIKKKLKYFFIGMGRADLNLKKKFFQFFGIHLLDIYGLAEIPLFCGEKIKDIRFRKNNSVGKLIKNYNVYITSKKKIIVSSKYNFSGYIVKKNIILSDKYYDTGDIGYFDANKNLILLGRTKNFIKSDGISINLNDYEEILKKNALVKDVLCRPVILKNKDMYDLIIELHKNTKLNQNKFKYFLSNKKFIIKTLRKIVFKKLKKTVTGKIKFN